MMVRMPPEVGETPPPQPLLRVRPLMLLRTTTLAISSWRVCRTIESPPVMYTKSGPARDRATAAAAAAARASAVIRSE